MDDEFANGLPELERVALDAVTRYMSGRGSLEAAVDAIHALSAVAPEPPFLEGSPFDGISLPELDAPGMERLAALMDAIEDE